MGRLIGQRQGRHQRDVVCKKLKTPAQKGQGIENSALGREPSCCLQDSPASAFGLAGVVVGDFVPPAEGGPGDISSNRPGASRATSADSPSRPADTPDRKRSSVDDNRCGVGAGMQAGCKPAVADDKEQAGKLADSRCSGDPSSGGSREEWKGFILSGSATKPERASPKIQCYKNL